MGHNAVARTVAKSRNACRIYPPLWHAEVQLKIEIPAVVAPGQPVVFVQLFVWQRHHLRETRIDLIHFIYQLLSNHDILITDNLDQSSVHTREVLACAFAWLESVGGEWHISDEDRRMSNLVGHMDIPGKRFVNDKPTFVLTSLLVCCKLVYNIARNK